MEYNAAKIKYEHLEERWVVNKIGIVPKCVQMFSYYIQAQHKQHWLRLRVTWSIHSAMGDTLFHAETEFSNDNDMFKIWDKAQVMVGCIRTRIGRNTIFVGDKTSTIDALTSPIQLKNLWKYYMELVLRLVSVNS